MAVGALESQFYRQFVNLLGLDPDALPDQYDREGWPVLREAFTTAFATRTRDEWAAVFDGTDACTTPVLTFGEAAGHPHLAARGTLAELEGAVQPSPAPRFSRTPAATPGPPPRKSVELADVIAEWGTA
jgi:alpha-methylacyl-CoA racemase